MREMFETGIFPTLFGAFARPETLAFSRPSPYGSGKLRD